MTDDKESLRESLEAKLAENPADTATRLVLADLLQTMGNHYGEIMQLQEMIKNCQERIDQLSVVTFESLKDRYRVSNIIMPDGSYDIEVSKKEKPFSKDNVGMFEDDEWSQLTSPIFYGLAKTCFYNQSEGNVAHRVASILDRTYPGASLFYFDSRNKTRTVHNQRLTSGKFQTKDIRTGDSNELKRAIFGTADIQEASNVISWLKREEYDDVRLTLTAPLDHSRGKYPQELIIDGSNIYFHELQKVPGSAHGFRVTRR